MGSPGDEGWERIDNADVLPEPGGKPTDVDDLDDEVEAEDGSAVQVPHSIAAPPQPSKEEVARHNLTHVNYRSWCPHCVAGRRNNTAHRSLPHRTRRVPLFVADYCFLRDVQDEDNLTCMVGRLYPSKAVFATACDQKGAEDPAVSRLAHFLKSAGIPKLVYKSDQEASIRSAIEEALRQIGRVGEHDAVEAVPESSAIGESASNGRAERTVQSFEDLLRTLKSALETRMQAKLPVQHAAMKWLIEHTASIMTRYVVNDEGMTPYQAIHGKRSTLKVVEFGEQVFYHVPKKLRAKLTQRWRLGTYLGLAPSSNEHFVATKQGQVIRSRSIWRVVEQSRWSSEAILGVVGTPSMMTPYSPQDIDSSIEDSDQPHLEKDADLRAELGDEDAIEAGQKRVVVHGRITDLDLKAYGFSDRCPRCRDIKRGFNKTQKHHTDECRLRIYKAWKDHGNKKYLKIKHLLEPEAPPDEEGRVDLELHEDDQRAQSQSVPTPTGPPQPSTPLGPAAVQPQADSWGSGHWDPSSHDDLSVPDDYVPLEELIPPDFMDPDVDDSDMFDIPDEAFDDPMVSALVALGCQRTDAQHRVNSMLKKEPESTFMEVYGGGSINAYANASRRNLGLKGIGALDLRTVKEDGTAWDFTKRADRKLARDLIDRENPDWLIGSPPCTSFSIWNYAMNFPKMNPEQVKASVEEGKLHLRFMASLYRKQMLKGKFFLHEHPATALSWKEPEITALLADPAVQSVVAHQCMYGLTTRTTKDGPKLPAMKPTRFMTNSCHMRNRLSRTCDGLHQHQQLVGGRCKEAAFYPLPLVRAIVLGMRDTRVAQSSASVFADERKEILSAITSSAGEIPSTQALETTPTSTIRRVTGGVLPIRYNPDQFKPKYIDEYTGEVLDPHLAQAAIMEELNYFNEKVWEVEEKGNMYKVDGHVFVRSRWVCCNKGDSASPDIRCRLVACEINKDGKNDNFFASTPPLEAKKLLFARFAQERSRNGEPLQLGFVDIRKAYFNGIPKRPVYMALPRELGLPSNYVGKLVRCAYGTRDAGAIWEDTYRGALEQMGFRSGIASPCCFYHPDRQLHLVVHGDDFTTMGIQKDLDWMEEELARHFELKIRGRLGENCTGPQQIRILNRIVTLTEEGLIYEADPRHVDLLSQSLGLTASNSVLTPGVKEPTPDYDALKEDESQPSNKISPTETIQSAHVNSLKTHRPAHRGRKVTFSSKVENLTVPAYSSLYELHPRFLAATHEGWKQVSPKADPYTSKSPEIMAARMSRIFTEASRERIRLHRARVLREYIDHLRCSALLQTRDVDKDRLLATRTPPAKRPANKRAGAKAVKAMEKLSCEYTLGPEEATNFRALSARSNFLAQDRGDIQYATKELCREFAIPNRNSYLRLKRTVRYLVGVPRLVHVYKWGQGISESDCYDIYVDTDFAGCKETRRSTSGGVVLLDGRLVKQWSKTQSTLALSSGEAELHGIAAGIAQGLGMKSIANDLGFQIGVRVHTDATAALGICRRRGLGKIRHLDVTDLWCQEQVRLGKVSLHKVLGSENPADIMTKYTDSATLKKMLGIMNLRPMEGRAACAPAVSTGAEPSSLEE